MRMGIRAFGSLICCSPLMAVLGFGGQHVVNPGFEDVSDEGSAKGWNNVKGPFAIRKGAGYNGTVGLAYDNDDPNRFVDVSQNVPLQPGKRYLVKALVRTENIRGEDIGAGVCVKFMPGGAYSRGIKGTTKDWEQVCFTSDIPVTVSVDSITVRPFVRKGCTGRAWFDDIVITDLDRPLVEVLTSSVYRNRAATGMVAFIATLNLQTTNGWNAAFSVTSAGSSRKLKAERFSCDCAAVRLPVSDLPVGKSTVVFVLKDPSGKPVAEKRMCFERFTGPDTRKVHFDAARRTIVNGKPFFPLGIYVDPRDKGCLDVVARSPFNCVLPGEVLEPLEMFKECERRNLMIVGSVGDYFAGIGRKCAYATEAEAEAALAERVAAGKGSPALLAWYMADEFPAHLARVLERRRELLERLDPDHPTYAVTCHPFDTRRMFGAYEVVGSDPYPIGKNPDKDIAQAAGWAAAVRKGTFGVRPMWQVPQIFDWIAHWRELENARAPTYEEMRSMFWQAIAEGANGLMCYAYHSLKWAQGHGHDPFDRRWADVCKAAAEVCERESLLLSAGPPPRLGPLPKGLSARGWTKDGVRTVVLANRLRERLSGEIEIDGVKLSFELPPIGVEFRTLEGPGSAK